MRYVALLRATNVGTANRVRMVDLLAALEKRGIRGATTYLQSGNAIFDWQGPAQEASAQSELAMSDLGLKSTAVLRNADQMRQIAKSSAFQGREEPEKTQFVTFLNEPFEGELFAGEATEILFRTPTEIYWVATPREGKAPTGPKLPKGVAAQSTTRNWIVTRALAELLKDK